ncbi:MAG TPA: mannose-6-phosphate isomerase [Candidatus Hydrogenedentes bacterium]|nr:mannose-6-phosphate isomerase [Candidatus Hydrogenedentota bacterium]
MHFGILKFRETYMPRLWGGDKLKRVLNRKIYATGAIGEAWLISDHPACESVVAEGEFAGETLRALMDSDGVSLLGSLAKPTVHGRFPLLLKLIDAGDVLSVQVHPDDEQAARLGEADAGKTEMWHVLDADSDSVMISGLRDGVTREAVFEALSSGDISRLVRSFPVAAGDSVFVAAGSAHAIGAGILLAEIQQNSNVTYRIFDWNRLDDQGAPRELHIEKALSALSFENARSGRAAPLRYTESGIPREVLAACRHFAAERITVKKHGDFHSDARSFCVVLALDDVMTIVAENSGCVLERGEAALIPACISEWRVEGAGGIMRYYVPDIAVDIVEPLLRHGYDEEQIRLLTRLQTT